MPQVFLSKEAKDANNFIPFFSHSQFFVSTGLNFWSRSQQKKKLFLEEK